MWLAITMIQLALVGQVTGEITAGEVAPALLPTSVRSVIASRRTHKTAEFGWTFTRFNEADYGLTEHFTTQTEGDTLWEVNAGDKRGYHETVYRSRDDPYPKEETAGPKQRLLHSGQVWSYDAWRREPPPNGFVSPVGQRGFFPLDFAYAGLAPARDSDRCGNALCLPADFAKGLKDMRFQSSRNGFTEVVVGSSDKYQIEWHLDHQQGGEPVFAAFYVDDVLTLSCVTEYQELGGRRVPLSMTFFRGDSVEPSHSIDVQRASFDQPEHATDISPADLGLLVGAQMSIPEAPFVLNWDGNELVTLEEFRELRNVYGLDEDPGIRKVWAEAWANATKRPVEEYEGWLKLSRAAARERYFEQHGTEPWIRKAGKEKDEWDVYVEKFVKEHKFDKEHKKTAEHILESAKMIRDRNQRATKRDVAQARKDGEYRRADALAEKIEKVKDRIFKRMLVRGLHRLAKKAKAKKG